MCISWTIKCLILLMHGATMKFKELHCCDYLDVSRLINEKQNLNFEFVHGAVDGFMHKEK